MARTARFALVQLPAFGIEDAETSLAHTLRRIDDAARETPDLIALPEVTYPAYFLGTNDLTSCNVRSPAEAMEAFAAKAREHRVYIAVGLALEAPSGGYANGAALFARDGSLAGRYDKAFLWHFDARWFSPGSAYPVFETDFGRVGMLVCADGRVPEIARSLALNGAQVILDLTAWVSGGRQPAELSNIQREYLMQVRAAENGVWLAAVSKCGVEAESIVYCGRSCVIDPRGEVVATLGPEDDAILVHEVPLADPAPPIARRPGLYEALTWPTESLPARRAAEQAAMLSSHEHHVAAVQMTMPPDLAAFLPAARRHIDRLALQDAELVLFPATPGRNRAAYPHDEMLSAMSKLAAERELCIGFTVSEGEAGSGMRAIYLVGAHGVIGRHRQTHKPDGPRFATMPLGAEPCGVFESPFGKVGLLCGAEAFVPEVARSLMLRGAEVLLWSTDAPSFSMPMTARARAAENRVSVVCAGAPTASGAAAIVDPAGRLLAVALEGRELSVSATINPMLSRIKTMAPGTDVLRNRQPHTYGVLTRERVEVGS